MSLDQQLSALTVTLLTLEGMIKTAPPEVDVEAINKTADYVVELAVACVLKFDQAEKVAS